MDTNNAEKHKFILIYVRHKLLDLINMRTRAITAKCWHNYAVDITKDNYAATFRSLGAWRGGRGGARVQLPWAQMISEFNDQSWSTFELREIAECSQSVGTDYGLRSSGLVRCTCCRLEIFSSLLFYVLDQQTGWLKGGGDSKSSNYTRKQKWLFELLIQTKRDLFYSQMENLKVSTIVYHKVWRSASLIKKICRSSYQLMSRNKFQRVIIHKRHFCSAANRKGQRISTDMSK